MCSIQACFKDRNDRQHYFIRSLLTLVVHRFHAFFLMKFVSIHVCVCCLFIWNKFLFTNLQIFYQLNQKKQITVTKMITTRLIVSIYLIQQSWKGFGENANTFKIPKFGDNIHLILWITSIHVGRLFFLWELIWFCFMISNYDNNY